MFKKFLAFFSALSVGILTTASVVSCGPITFNKLMERSINPETFYGKMDFQINNWNSSKTMQGADAEQIVNVTDAMLQNDNYNYIIGDLADGWKANEDFTQWTVHLNEDAEWFDYHGNRLTAPKTDGGIGNYKIKAHHVANTVRYAFNPTLFSETKDLWESLLKNGDVLSKKMDDLDKEFEKEAPRPGETAAAKIKRKQLLADRIISMYIKGDLPNNQNWSIGPDGKVNETIKNQYEAERKTFQEENPDAWIIEVNDKTGEIIYNMEAPAEYFDSVLTYVAFAPLPDEAVDFLGLNLLNADNYGNTYKHILNSGAYVVTNHDLTSLSFKANPNYRNLEDVHIKNIVLSFRDNANPSIQLSQFETGDLNEMLFTSTDRSGWSRYVGDDKFNPRFEGTHILTAPSFTNYFMTYNYGAKRSANDDPRQNPVNWAISQLSSRALINYALDRQKSIIFYTNGEDPNTENKYNQRVSSLSSNTYVPYGLINWENNGENGIPNKNAGKYNGIKERVGDYTDLLSDQYLMKTVKPAAEGLNIEVDGANEATKLKMGQDLLYRNDFIAYQSLGNTVGVTNPDMERIKKFQDDFKDAKTFEAKIQILVDKVQYDFDKEKIPFNASNPVTFEFIFSGRNRDTSYGSFDDMAKIFNDKVLNSPIKIDVKITGTHDEYNTQVREKNYNLMVSGWAPDFSDPSTFLNTIRLNGNLARYNNFSSVVNTETIKNDHFNQITEFITSYSNGLREANKKIGYDRYNGYAEQEAFYLYDSLMMMPFYIKDQLYRPIATYLDIFTQTTIEVGTSREKYIRRKMIPKLWTKAEYEDAKAEYEDEVSKNKALQKSKDDNYYNKSSNA